MCELKLRINKSLNMNKEDILNFTGYNFQLSLFYVLVRRSASYNHLCRFSKIKCTFLKSNHCWQEIMKRFFRNSLTTN